MAQIGVAGLRSTIDEALMSHRVTLLTILALMVAITGCAPPLLGYSLDSPAMVHTQIRQAGIVDRRAEFRSLFCGLMQRDHPQDGATCNHWLQRFPDEMAPVVSAPVSSGAGPSVDIVMVSGIFSECLPKVPVFGDAVEGLRALGYRISYAPIKGRASSEANAAIIRDHILQARSLAPRRPVVIVAYSKGVADTMSALAAFPELGEAVGAVVGVAGAVNGSPVADQLLQLYSATAARLPYRACPVNDGGEVRSLTRAYRLNWLATHALPSSTLYFSIAGVPSPERVSALFEGFHRSLSRMEPRNDGQIIYYDAILPHSTLLGYANADHFAIALPFESTMSALTRLGINHNNFPRAQLLEAAIRTAETALAERGMAVTSGGAARR